MKAKIVAVLSVISILASNAQAFLWNGDIIETITSSNNAAFQVGQVFTGSYSYHSDDINGTYYATEYSNNWNPPGSNSSLAGELTLGIPLSGGGYGTKPYSITDTLYINYLTVVDGKVGGLFWQDQQGWSNFYFTGLNFMFYTGGFGSSSIVRGTLQFSDPVDPPEPVSDASTTFGLLALSLGGAVFLRRRSSV